MHRRRPKQATHYGERLDGRHEPVVGPVLPALAARPLCRQRSRPTPDGPRDWRWKPGTGKLRFIEVKGRVTGASTVTITKNEILTALNKPEDFILAIGLIEGERVDLRYLRRPFQREPDFAVTSVNYDLDELLAHAEDPM